MHMVDAARGEDIPELQTYIKQASRPADWRPWCAVKPACAVSDGHRAKPDGHPGRGTMHPMARTNVNVCSLRGGCTSHFQKHPTVNSKNQLFLRGLNTELLYYFCSIKCTKVV